MLKLFQSFSGKWSFHRDIVHKAIASHTTSTVSSSINVGGGGGSCPASNGGNFGFGEQHMTVTGTAIFIPQDDDQSPQSPQLINTYKYNEEGILKQSDGNSFNVTQRYIYRYNKDDDKICVLFDEKPERLLHSLDFINSSLAMGHHLCGSDHYDATYQFISPREFKLTYSVVGPRKNYKISTIFIKVSI
eukprot:gene3986-4987_t